MPTAFGFADQRFRRWMASGQRPVFIPTLSVFMFFRTFGDSVQFDGSAKSQGSCCRNEIKLVVASHPNKLQVFYALCALSRNLLYANNFRLLPTSDSAAGWRPDKVRFLFRLCRLFYFSGLLSAPSNLIQNNSIFFKIGTILLKICLYSL